MQAPRLIVSTGGGIDDPRGVGKALPRTAGGGRRPDSDPHRGSRAAGPEQYWMPEPRVMPGSDNAKVLLATFGTLGDLYPFIAMAKAIAACGLEPVIAAQEMHREAIESEAIGYAPMRPDIS